MKASDKSDLISTEIAARLIQVTPRRVRQLAKEGWFKAKSRDRWAIVEVVQGYIRFLKATAKRAAAGDNRLRDARAREIELRVARQDGTVIDVAEAVDAIDKITGRFLESITGLPAQITRDIRERQRIEQICDKERGHLERRFAEVADSIRTGVDVADASLADDA